MLTLDLYIPPRCNRWGPFFKYDKMVVSVSMRSEKNSDFVFRVKQQMGTLDAIIKNWAQKTNTPQF